jgi:glycerophosphoryl diester phosphodiesterase
MRKRLCALSAVLATGIAPILIANNAAYADSMEEVSVAHRGALTSKWGEGTLASYKHAVENRADILDADVRWTKDGSDRDKLGTMVILHDAKLDRITKCKGAVSSWRWSAISRKCRTRVGHKKLIRLVDLLKYGNSVGKSFGLQIKVSSITNAQAKQFWKAVRNSRVQLEASPGQLAALRKIKKLDAADRRHKISYGLITLGAGGWPSVATIKKVGTSVHATVPLPAKVARRYQQAHIKVFLFTGKNKSQYARMIALHPYAVVVNDVARFQRWRDVTKKARLKP